MSGPAPSVRLHLTNVAGTGAAQLLLSLLPALESDPRAAEPEVYLPDRGPLASYRCARPETRVATYHRRLPNGVSRLLECILFGHRFDGSTPLLVLGDLPLRCDAPQTVFVHQRHLLRGPGTPWNAGGIRFGVSRTVFASNLRYARAFIVQTPTMREALIASYPALGGKVHVIPQPAPRWLLEARLERTGRIGPRDGGLDLFYPSAGYPHKNHRLLAGIGPEAGAAWPVRRLALTLDRRANPAPGNPWIDCVGLLSAREMVDAYRRTDGLLFLSRLESYGLPLVEAMMVGIPIVCPDLPYARTLCGEEAVYFVDDDVASLKAALATLRERLAGGWWPDWRPRLAGIPHDWQDVACRMLDVVFSTAH